MVKFEGYIVLAIWSLVFRIFWKMALLVQDTCGVVEEWANPKQIATVLISFVSCTMGSPPPPKKVPEILNGGFQIIRGQSSRSANQRRECKSWPIKDVHILFGVDL